MQLEDILTDYISVFPDGSLDYLKYYIKQTNNNLMNFIKNIELDIKINSLMYKSIYMQKFLHIIKNEYEERLKISPPPVTNKSLSIKASEYVPSTPEYIPNTNVLKEVALKDISEQILRNIFSYVDNNMNQDQFIPIRKIIENYKYHKYINNKLVEYTCTIEEFILIVKNQKDIIIKDTYYKSTHWKTLNMINYQNAECLLIINDLIKNKGSNNGILLDIIMINRFIKENFSKERLKTLIIDSGLHFVNYNNLIFITY